MKLFCMGLTVDVILVSLGFCCCPLKRRKTLFGAVVALGKFSWKESKNLSCLARLKSLGVICGIHLFLLFPIWFSRGLTFLCI